MSASNMYEALKARPVKGTTAAVCDLGDAVPQEIKVNRINNFSAFHNFSYDTKNLCMSKAYGIGSGKVVTWSELNVQNQSGVPLSVLDDQGFFSMQPRPMKLSQDMPNSHTDSTDEEILLECKEPCCSLSFTTLGELQDHMNFGQHNTEILKNQESLYDQLRRQWAFKFSTLSDKVEKKQAFNETPLSNGSSVEAAGWALQKSRSRKKFSDNVKLYLTSKFDAGVTGRKTDPAQVSKDMRKARNDDGSRKFSREEWLTKVQIKSFFSRLSASRGKQQPMQEDSDDDLLEEELEYEEEEIRDEEMKDMLSQLGVEHPITYDGYDICAHVKSDSLSKFTVKILKRMCEYFELPCKSRDSKAVLLDKIIVMVKDCTCSR